MATQNKVRKQNLNIRLPLIGSMTNRDYSADKDQRFVNVFPETRKVDQIESTKIFMNKRPGMMWYRTYGTPASYEGRGCAYFKGRFYVAIGDKVYEDDGTPASIITLNGTTGHVGFTLGNSTTVGDYLFISDGTDCWIINSSYTVTKITASGVYGIAITNGGVYGNTPTVSFGAPGSGCTTSVTLTSGVVTGVNILTQGTSYSTGSTVTFSDSYVQFAYTDIDTSAATATSGECITMTGHTFATGNAIVYTNGGGTTPTTSPQIVTGQTYYIIKLTDDKVRLATTLANAQAGTNITFSTQGAGSAHRLTGTVATGTIIINNLPVPHVPTPIFIDGYIALARSPSGDIYTCDLEEPTKWNASNFITAEMFPDELVALGRQNNQVVALGLTSVEFFYDAANATGSPFSRNESTTLQMGCCSPYAIYQNEKFLIFIGQSDSGGRAVWKVEGFQPTKISDEFIDRILDNETDATAIYGYGFRTMGHMFYLINLPVSNRTLVYDVEEKLWHEWSSNASGEHSVFKYNHCCDNNSGKIYLLGNTSSSMMYLAPTVYRDATSETANDNIICDIITNKFDMDTIKRKFLTNVRIVGDSYEDNACDIRWTDDDYRSWSGWKQIILTDEYPSFARLGTFRRRAFQIRHNQNRPFRCESLEVTFSEGES